MSARAGPLSADLDQAGALSLALLEYEVQLGDSTRSQQLRMIRRCCEHGGSLIIGQHERGGNPRQV